MAPLHLQGLNLVHSTSPAPQNDSHDPLASPPFPDFSAHLDLWTNLAFESDEPLSHNKGKRKSVDESDEDSTSVPSRHSIHDSVVHPPSTTISPHSDAHGSHFYINAILAGFGIDPFLAQHAPPAHTENMPPAPSLAQLLALHTAQGGTYSVPPPPPVVHAHSAPQPPVKRARTTKNSASTETHDDVSSPSVEGDPDSSINPLSATEDKRRRNTAASARFRLKKKEREAALERRAKELEERVVDLERECEGLRRENGWLKGLVVGVTGAGAGTAK
jgi:hypothetical protein